MKLLIHDRQGSFSERWIAHCNEHQISYALVNCFETDILQNFASADALLWHWHHQDQREQLIARQVLKAAEMMGIAVFPNIATCWHFDDKIAQKYLLEAVEAPLVPTYVFYDLKTALHWTDNASFPKVFKLRKGAGSVNVRLVRTRKQARALTKQAFSCGFKPVPEYWNDAAKRYRVTRRRGDFFGVLRRVPSTLAKIRKMNQTMGREKGYVYFQDLVPENQFDTRVTIIGNRAFAFTRNVRPGDFRASGSGDIDYDIRRIRLECVTIAFDTARKTGSQSMALDFVLSPNDGPMIVEVSYCYDPTAVYRCEGHWDLELNWHAGHLWPQDAILIDLLETIAQRQSAGQLTLNEQPAAAG